MSRLLLLVLALWLPRPLLASDHTGSPPAPASAANNDNEAAADAAPQDGSWKPLAAVLAGARLPKEAVQAITLKINGNKYEVTIKGEEQADRGTYKLDTSTTPKRMTITGTDGPNKGKTILAIYEMKNANAMRVCYDLSGKDFPTEFKAPKGTQLYLVGYRR